MSDPDKTAAEIHRLLSEIERDVRAINADLDWCLDRLQRMPTKADWIKAATVSVFAGSGLALLVALVIALALGDAA